MPDTVDTKALKDAIEEYKIEMDKSPNMTHHEKTNCHRDATRRFYDYRKSIK